MSAKLPVVVDTREPVDLVAALGFQFGADIPLRREKLDSGDFLMIDHRGTALGIERKTVADFLGSIRDGRIESQLARMCEDYDARILLIQGKYSVDNDGYLVTGGRLRQTTGWKYAAFQAKLLSIQGKYDTRVLTVGSDTELGIVIKTLYRQGEEDRFHV